MQDRKLWQQTYFSSAKQLILFAESVGLGASGRFLIEAKIAKAHCTATSFPETDWQIIVALYEQLFTITQSPIVLLNKAVALGYLGHLSEAISLANELATYPLLKNAYFRFAVLAHLNAKAGKPTLAYQLAEQSIALGGTQHEHQVMMRQLDRLLKSKHY